MSGYPQAGGFSAGWVMSADGNLPDDLAADLDFSMLKIKGQNTEMWIYDKRNKAVFTFDGFLYVTDDLLSPPKPLSRIASNTLGYSDGGPFYRRKALRDAASNTPDFATKVLSWDVEMIVPAHFHRPTSADGDAKQMLEKKWREYVK